MSIEIKIYQVINYQQECSSIMFKIIIHLFQSIPDKILILNKLKGVTNKNQLMLIISNNKLFMVDKDKNKIYSIKKIPIKKSLMILIILIQASLLEKLNLNQVLLWNNRKLDKIQLKNKSKNFNKKENKLSLNKNLFLIIKNWIKIKNNKK